MESYQQKLEEEENLNDKYEADIDRMKDELKERKTEIWLMKEMMNAKDKEITELKSKIKLDQDASSRKLLELETKYKELESYC